MSKDCPYCPFSHPGDQLLFENDLAVFCINEHFQGALKHSGIIVPKEHRETVFDMTHAELAASFSLLETVKDWMEVEFDPDGYNIGWNCYPAAGQEVMHAHMHVIPRFSNEPLAGKGIRAHLKGPTNER